MIVFPRHRVAPWRLDVAWALWQPARGSARAAGGLRRLVNGARRLGIGWQRPELRALRDLHGGLLAVSSLLDGLAHRVAGVDRAALARVEPEIDSAVDSAWHGLGGHA